MRRRSLLGRDEGNLYALEALVVITILAANLAFVMSLDHPSNNMEGTRVDLNLAARDSLVLLERAVGDDPVFANDAARQYVTQALYGDPVNLSRKLTSLLPAGARHSVYLDNGLATRELIKGPGPAKERVTAQAGFSSNWATTLIVPDFEVHSATAGRVTFTTLPVFHGRVLSTASVPVEIADGSDQNLTTSLGNGFVEGVVTPLPSAGSPQANVTLAYKDELLAGRAKWTLGAAGAEDSLLVATQYLSRSGLNASAVTLDTAVTRPGDTVTVAYDFTALETALGTNVVPGSFAVNVSLVAPTPPPTNATPSYYATAWTASATTTSGTLDLDIPFDTLFGVHLVDVRLSYTLTNGGATEIEQAAHLVERLDVAFKDGTEAPLNPGYRIVLEVWFDDWL